MALRLLKTPFSSMHVRSTHLRKLFPHPSTWFGATNACNYALGGVFFNGAGEVFVWQWPLPLALHQRIQSIDKPARRHQHQCTRAAHVLQFLLKTLHMDPLKHTLDGVDSTTAHRRNVRGS